MIVQILSVLICCGIAAIIYSTIKIHTGIADKFAQRVSDLIKRVDVIEKQLMEMAQAHSVHENHMRLQVERDNSLFQSFGQRLATMESQFIQRQLLAATKYRKPLTAGNESNVDNTRDSE